MTFYHNHFEKVQDKNKSTVLILIFIFLQVADVAQGQEIAVCYFKPTQRGRFTKSEDIYMVELRDIIKPLPPPYESNVGRRKFYTFMDF